MQRVLVTRFRVAPEATALTLDENRLKEKEVIKTFNCEFSRMTIPQRVDYLKQLAGQPGHAKCIFTYATNSFPFEDSGVLTGPDLCLLFVDSLFTVDPSLLPILSSGVEVDSSTGESEKALKLESYGIGFDPQVLGQSKKFEATKVALDMLKNSGGLAPGILDVICKTRSKPFRCFCVEDNFKHYDFRFVSRVSASDDLMDETKFTLLDGSTTTGVYIECMSGGPVVERSPDGSLMFKGVISMSGLHNTGLLLADTSPQTVSDLKAKLGEGGYSSLKAEILPEIYQWVTSLDPFISWAINAEEAAAQSDHGAGDLEDAMGGGVGGRRWRERSNK